MNIKEIKIAYLELTGNKLPPKTKKAEAEILLAEAQKSANKPVDPKRSASQKASMAIKDRRVLCLDTGEIYKNSSAVWKADLISSSQCDTLSGKLIGAAKQGEFPVIEIAGGKYQLAQGTGK